MSSPSFHQNANRTVLVVGEFGILNGGEKSFLAIAPSLIELGWELIAAVPETTSVWDSNNNAGEPTEFARALKSIGIEILDWNVRDFCPQGKRKELTQIRKELAAIIKSVNPALVHFNSLSTSRIGGPLTSQLEIASLGYLRDIMKVSKAAIADINRVDKIVAVSQATKDWHAQQGVVAKKTIVIHNGVDSESFRPFDKTSNEVKNSSHIREDLSIPPTDQVLLFVGQIGKRKGVDTLVDAFLELAKTNKSVHLLIVGDRHSQKEEAVEYESLLHEQVSQSGHADRVHFLGRRSDIAGLMRAADLLVHPAYQEPLGRVLLEAAASGLAIATTDVGGSREILCDAEDSHGLSKLMVPPRDQTAMTHLMAKLLSSPIELEQIGTKLRARAVSNFPIEKCADQIDDQYRMILQSQPAK